MGDNSFVCGGVLGLLLALPVAVKLYQRQSTMHERNDPAEYRQSTGLIIGMLLLLVVVGLATVTWFGE